MIVRDSANQTEASNYAYADATEIHMHNLLFPAVDASVKFHRPFRVLDLGCGNGYLTEQLRLANPKIEFYGIDPSDDGIAHAKTAFPTVHFRQGSVYDTPPTEWSGSFDLVISTEVVEHLYAPRSLPVFIKAVLKPGGIAVITTPYHGYLKNLALSLMDKWNTHHSPLWDHGHVKFWSRPTLEQLFSEHGFNLNRFQGIGRVPYLWMTMLMEFRLPLVQ